MKRLAILLIALAAACSGGGGNTSFRYAEEPNGELGDDFGNSPIDAANIVDQTGGNTWELTGDCDGGGDDDWFDISAPSAWTAAAPTLSWDATATFGLVVLAADETTVLGQNTAGTSSPITVTASSTTGSNVFVGVICSTDAADWSVEITTPP